MKSFEAELIKCIKRKSIIMTSLIVIGIEIFLYLWMSLLANETILEPLLKNSQTAGVFSLLFFASFMREIWAVVIGANMLGMEYKDESITFSIQNGGRYRFYLMKQLVFGFLTFLICSLIYILPTILAWVLFHDAKPVLLTGTIIEQIFVVILMTFATGNLTMLLTSIFKNSTIPIVLCIILTFSAGYVPERLRNIINLLNPYTYLSQTIKPLRDVVANMKNLNIRGSEMFHSYDGIIAFVLFMVIVIVGYVILQKKVQY